MPIGKLDDPRHVGIRVARRYDVKTVDLGFLGRLECPVEFGKVAEFDRHQLEIQGLCRPLGYRQFTVLCRLQAVWKFMRRDERWGTMRREGFAAKAADAARAA